MTTKATKRNVATRPMISRESTFASHVDVDDLPEPDDAADHQHDADADGDQAEGVLEERHQIVPVARVQEQGHRERQGTQDERRDASLGGQRLDLAPETVP